MSPLVPRTLLVLVGAFTGLAAVEGYVRFQGLATDTIAANESYQQLNVFKEQTVEDVNKQFVIDNEFGFRPALGTNTYSEFGTLINEYDVEDPGGRERLLFMGDSVTRRGKIVDALRDVYGDERYEYWNGGVGSFGTVQEVNYYKSYTSKVRPDHVVLQFHNNDFLTTPVSMKDEEGRIVVYAPAKPRRHIPLLWLFDHSHLYRLLFERLVGLNDDTEIRDEIRDSLRELQELTAEEGVDLTVLLLPILLPREEWRGRQERNHAIALEIFDELGLRYFDLSEPLWEALDDGVDPMDGPGDWRHPSREVSAYFAEYLAEQGLLSAPAAAAD